MGEGKELCLNAEIIQRQYYIELYMQLLNGLSAQSDQSEAEECVGAVKRSCGTISMLVHR